MTDAVLDELPRIVRLVRGLVDELGEEQARCAVRGLCASFSPLEQAALVAHWPLWARPKQLAPTTIWKSWGFLCGRGFGKTLAASKYVNAEVHAGRARLICVVAQDEASAVAIQVLGPSGLIATAPPLAKPYWEASSLRLIWPNGAIAYVRTPEVPGKIRGLEYQLAWTTELQSWPVALREEAFDNVVISTRLGYARHIWDATPKKGHPILRQLLQQAERHPADHVVVRGTTYENAANLGDGYIDNLDRKFGGTARGREELLGEMLEDAEGAVFKSSWIRRRAPGRTSYRVVSVDPAVSDRKGSDTTGIVTAALLEEDDTVLVERDESGRLPVERWGAMVLDRYEKDECDLLLAETNKGGRLVAQMLRTLATERGLTVVVIGKEDRPRRIRGTVFVREIYAQGQKAERAEPVATAYEKRRVFHADGADLEALETTMTTWEPRPNADSPGNLDAMVHAVVELLGLREPTVDAREAFRGTLDMARRLSRDSAPSADIARLLRGARRPDRI